MIDLRRLEILRELDRCKTVAATAVAVHLTPSAVSQQIASLAREAGTAMVEPDGRRIRLTAAAQILLAHAHAVFTHLEHAESELAAFRRGDAGTVRLGVFPSAISPIVMPALAVLSRTSRVRVEIHEIADEGGTDALLARSADLNLTLSAMNALRGSADPRVGEEHLLADALDVCLPSHHRLAADREVDLGDLAGDDWITSPPGSTCWQIAEAACSEAGFTPHIRHRVSEFAALTALVAAGFGVALLPRLAQHCAGNALAVRPARGTTPVRNVGVRYRSGTAGQPHIAPLLASLTRVCAELGTIGCVPGPAAGRRARSGADQMTSVGRAGLEPAPGGL